ncbi:MAG TPA: serine/threonine-protein kinase [Thermoanaerobaculia bacterium]|nr:serine/threonine-protein kinase [Thermoanaerobaculia bacterium]
MAAERWHQIERIFAEVGALPAKERADRLARRCGNDEDLRREVESLLAADVAGGDFLEQPVLAVSPPPPPSAVGRRFGPYSVERQLGEGGMSTVYLAERADEEYRQQVAIKVFAYGTERADLRERFRAERQILASLDHPNIARLLDGGTTEDGLPYLVMEYVDGVPISRFCDERRLSVGERIDLFRQVCAAVQYAHQNLVVHRDIKPSNILVTADGVPHLLDFGIAKLLGGSALPRAAAETTTGQRLMTPPYASPEQVEGRPVTTASDVYSLGVLLYVLLTGRLPYRFDGERVGAIEQAVVEQQPERPSSAIGPRKLARQVAGDLDNIVLMALRKEPGRRYASVGLLSEDLRRHRAGLPVLARPATVGYRVGKFVRRHRLGVGVAALLALVILGLAATMSVQAVRLARQRDQIQSERDKAVEVAEFLEEIFSAADPSQARGETVTAREVLERGAFLVTNEPAGQPEVQAALTATIGRVYVGLGLYDRAQPLLERSLAVRQRVFGTSHLEVAESLFALGELHLGRGELSRAAASFRQSLAMRERLLGPSDPAVADSLNGLGIVLVAQAKFDTAEPLLRRALAINRERRGESHPEVATNLVNLGLLMKQKGELAAAEIFYQQSLAILRRRFGGAHPHLANQLNNLAVLQHERGETARAAASYREILAIDRRLYGPEHPEIALHLNNFAAMLLLQGDHQTAEPLLRESLAMRRKLLGDDHEQVAMGLNNLAKLLEKKGDLAQARPLYEESLRICRRAFGEEHPRVALALANLANLLAEQGDPAAAEPLARQALAIRRRVLVEAHPDIGSSLVLLGSLLLARDAEAEAEPLLRQGLDVLRATLSDTHWRTAEAQSQLGGCLAALGRRAEAEPLLTAGFATLAGARGPRDRRTLAAERRLRTFRQGR